MTMTYKTQDSALSNALHCHLSATILQVRGEKLFTNSGSVLVEHN